MRFLATANAIKEHGNFLPIVPQAFNVHLPRFQEDLKKVFTQSIAPVKKFVDNLRCGLPFGKY